MPLRAACVHADGSQHLALTDPQGRSSTCDWALLGWEAPPKPAVPEQERICEECGNDLAAYGYRLCTDCLEETEPG